jgi:hypothetical protein
MREAAARRMEGAAATGAEAEAALAGHTATIQGKIAALPIKDLLRIQAAGLDAATKYAAIDALSKAAKATDDPAVKAQINEKILNILGKQTVTKPGVFYDTKTVENLPEENVAAPPAQSSPRATMTQPGRAYGMPATNAPDIKGPGLPAAIPPTPTTSPLMGSPAPQPLGWGTGWGVNARPTERIRPATGVSVGGGRFRTDEEQAVAGTMISKTPDERLATLAVRYPKDPLLLAEVRRRRGGGGGGRPAPQMAASPLFA